MTEGWKTLTWPTLPQGYFWDNRLEKRDGNQSLALRLVGPDQCIVDNGRIDLEFYGLHGALERAKSMADRLVVSP